MSRRESFETADNRIWKVKRNDDNKITSRKEVASFTMKVQKIINAGHKSQSGGLLVEVSSALMNTTSEMTRAVIIPFLKTERRRSEDQFQAESRRHELEDVAVHCLPLLVSIASDLKKEKSHILQKCRVFVARILSHLSDADDRLHLTYGILLFVAQLLLQKANIEKLGPEQAETFLQTTVMKYGIEQFQVGNAMLNGLPSPTKTIADMAKLIIEAVQVCHIGELLTAVNPRVDVGGTIGLAFHLVTLLNILFAHGIDHPSKDICRQAISADPMMSGVQVYLNVERHHDIISRGGVKATGPRNRRGIWMPYSRFSQTQLREIESVFQIQTGTGAQVHVIGMQEDIQRNAEERSERGEENNAEDVMETDVEMVDVSDPVEKNSTELNETKEHREPAGPVTLESAHRKLFVDETQSSTARLMKPRLPETRKTVLQGRENMQRAQPLKQMAPLP